MDAPDLSSAMTTENLRNISDTALWVAQYRVMESERPDAPSAFSPASSSVPAENDRAEHESGGLRVADDRPHGGHGRISCARSPRRIDTVLNLAAG
jgi:hypothetical protein